MKIDDIKDAEVVHKKIAKAIDAEPGHMSDLGNLKQDGEDVEDPQMKKMKDMEKKSFGGRIASSAQYETKIPAAEQSEDGVNEEKAQDKRLEKERNEGTEKSPRNAAIAMEYFIFLIK